MNIFKRRTKPTENLTFVAITTAITVAFFAVLNFVPFSFLIIIMIFPFISFVVGTICQKRYFILYFLASFLLSLTFSFHDISNLLFYLVPALITGFVMAILGNKKFSLFFQIGVATIIQLFLTLLFVPVIEVIYEVNIIWDLVELFGFSSHPYINSFVIPFILLISFIQTFLSYFFIILFSKSIKIEIVYKTPKNYFYGGFAAFFGFLCFIFSFFKLIDWLNFVLFFISIYFFILMLVDIKYKSVLEIIFLIISLIVAIVCYVVCFELIPAPNHLCVTSIGISIYGIYYSINRGIFKK